MRKLFIVITAVLILAGFGLSAQASTVYNAANQVIAETTAQAIEMNPVSALQAGLGKTIDINVSLPCQLSVSINNSRVDWTINSVGDYRILAAKIDVITNLNSDVTMKVEGAGNLVKTDEPSQSLETYYSFKTSSGIPGASEPYLSASAFNGNKKIPVGSGAGIGYQGTAYLWNRINATSGKPAGTYFDSFTVTFSQNL